jgi:hypothetical protein
LAATGVPKLKIMLTEESVFLRTLVNVNIVKDELFKNKSVAPRGSQSIVKKDSIVESNIDRKSTLT